MLKKTITFEDLDGNTITEDFYFNISKAELVEMEVSEQEGLSELFQKIVLEKDNKQLVEHFKKFILLAYGVKGEDGRRFIKSPEISEEFAQTDAYSELFLELATDDKAASAFITGAMPSSLAGTLKEKLAEEVVSLPETPAEPKHHEDAVSVPTPPTSADLESMSREDLMALLASSRDQLR